MKVSMNGMKFGGHDDGDFGGIHDVFSKKMVLKELM